MPEASPWSAACTAMSCQDTMPAAARISMWTGARPRPDPVLTKAAASQGPIPLRRSATV